jgi:hypothetical protein
MSGVARKLRTDDEQERFRLALVPVDQAFWESEQKYGVGRLERLVSSSTLAAYRRGWTRYRQAVEASDGAEVEIVGPLMIAALAFMDREATQAGHPPLAPDTWEAPLGDGRTLVVVRSNAEAAAVLRGAKGGSWETTLPPDLAVTVRNQHEGRALVVITMAEIVGLLKRAEREVNVGTTWEGDAAPSGRVMGEGAAADLARSGYPLPVPIGADVSVPLPF